MSIRGDRWGKVRRSLIVWGALTVAPWSAHAQVTEPNGLRVPATCPASEICLQTYFNGLNPPDAINALNEASVNPGTYSPPCTFTAELVLSQAANAAGLAWYNVPADPTSKPAAVYALVPESAMVGTKVTSTTIRTDPNYAGGLIGFALMENSAPVYYSEYMRNVLCSGCTTPDHWKLMLAYASKLAANTYYLAFEDGPGANATTWPNDGDFNDKVFKLTGVRCPGGGEPCDTGKLGACAQGLTECQANQPLSCKQIVQPKPEICDSVDNDCDGVVDGPGLCNAGMVCLRGICVKSWSLSRPFRRDMYRSLSAAAPLPLRCSIQATPTSAPPVTETRSMAWVVQRSPASRKGWPWRIEKKRSLPICKSSTGHASADVRRRRRGGPPIFGTAEMLCCSPM